MAARSIIGPLLRLGDRAVRGAMTPRTNVGWININALRESIRSCLINTPHPRLPAAEGHPDNMLGITLPKRRDHETVAGLVIGELQHMPETGEAVETVCWRSEMIDLDGRRIDKVIAARVDNREAA